MKATQQPDRKPRRPWGSLGIPSTGRHRRRYKRHWTQLRRREDPQLRRREAARHRAYLARPGVREKQRDRNRAWRRARRAHLAAYNRRYHDECRARRCFFCDRRAPRGRYGLRPIERLVMEQGEWVQRTVLCCGKCQGDPLKVRHT